MENENAELENENSQSQDWDWEEFEKFEAERCAVNLMFWK